MSFSRLDKRKNLVSHLTETNRSILVSVLRSIEFCGKQGLALHNSTDEGFMDEINPFEEVPLDLFRQSNLDALYHLCAKCGDSALKDHFERSKSSGQFTCKKSQDQLMNCVKEFLQQLVVTDIEREGEYSLYGLRVVEVTSQLRAGGTLLAIIVRYVKNKNPVERMVEILDCEETTGKAIAKGILGILTKIGLDPQLCRSQTYEVEGNLTKVIPGVVAALKKDHIHWNYFHSAECDLNAEIQRSCYLPEVIAMLHTLRNITDFFKGSLKKQKRLEHSAGNINQDRKKQGDAIIRTNQILAIFSPDWLEKNTLFEDFMDVYEALLDCFEAFLREKNWDAQTVTNAEHLLQQITSPGYIVSFQVCRQFSGYLKSLSVLLKGSSQDVLSGYDKLSIMRLQFVYIKENLDIEFDVVYDNILSMCKLAHMEGITVPPMHSRRSKRGLLEGENTQDYWKRVVFLPYVEHLINELDARFGESSAMAVHGLKLIPAHLKQLKDDSVSKIVDYHRQDLSSPGTFSLELKLWKRYWAVRDKPVSLQDTLRTMNSRYFPNIHKVLSNMLLLPVTVIPSHKGRRPCMKNLQHFRYNTYEAEHTVLVLLNVQKQMKLDYEEIIRVYSKKYPRRMNMLNPISES